MKFFFYFQIGLVIFFRGKKKKLDPLAYFSKFPENNVPTEKKNKPLCKGDWLTGLFYKNNRLKKIVAIPLMHNQVGEFVKAVENVMEVWLVCLKKQKFQRKRS